MASATDALSQFAPGEAGTGSALFNSLRQLGAAMGVALPAVAFELARAGDQGNDAALSGSAAAFLLRLVVLIIPLIMVATRWRSGSTPPGGHAQSVPASISERDP
ncbi:MAG: hypothetical protein M3395_05950 [Chloroflexota bacterium]|nr:hypothetical protein [Chloroflexota bacterium]